MDKDIPPLGGVRSKRYTLVIENNTVTKIFEEPDGTGIKRTKNNFYLTKIHNLKHLKGATCSLADNLLKQI